MTLCALRLITWLAYWLDSIRQPQQHLPIVCADPDPEAWCWLRLYPSSSLRHQWPFTLKQHCSYPRHQWAFVIQGDVCTGHLSPWCEGFVSCCTPPLGSSEMLPFIMAQRSAKVRIIAHRRLISSPLPNMHSHRHARTNTHTFLMFHLAYPCHYPAADVTRGVKKKRIEKKKDSVVLRREMQSSLPVPAPGHFSVRLKMFWREGTGTWLCSWNWTSHDNTEIKWVLNIYKDTLQGCTSLFWWVPITVFLLVFIVFGSGWTTL